MNGEVHKRTGIEKELASRADQRVSRWCGHVERIDEYRMARRVLMVVMRYTEVRMDGSCEGGLGQQRSDGGGCATICKRYERVESPGT